MSAYNSAKRKRSLFAQVLQEYDRLNNEKLLEDCKVNEEHIFSEVFEEKIQDIFEIGEKE